MKRGTPCPTCGWWHASDDTQAVNRFAAGGSVGYRAAYLGAPLRATRAEAESDACQHRARRNDRHPELAEVM